MISVPAEFAAAHSAGFNKDGKLFLTTVLVTTPDSKVYGFEVLRAWIDGDSAVLPRSLIFPANKKPGEIKAQEQAQMTSSQQRAIYAALDFLGYKVPGKATVVDFLEQSGAKGLLEAGDIIREVDGKRIENSDQVIDQVRKKNPGENIEIIVERNGERKKFSNIKLIENSSGAAIGIFLKMDFDFPFEVGIDIADTGGPSAGLIFSLGIIEKLSEEDFLRGRKVAGTGTIDLKGRVGAIGGIEAKMIGAAKSGATLFLAPAGNCDEVRHIPKGLQVIPIATLKEAVEVMRDRDLSDRPSCSAPR